jgi:hypothetical protein
MGMNIRRGLFRLWIVFACLFVIAVGVALSYPIRREFEKAGAAKAILIRIEREGILFAPCSVRGRRPFDVLQPNGRCGYDISKFKAQHPEYRNLDEDELVYRLCDEAGINIKMPFSPWTKVIEAGGIAVGVPAVVLILGWASLWAYAGFRPAPLEA